MVTLIKEDRSGLCRVIADRAVNTHATIDLSLEIASCEGLSKTAISCVLVISWHELAGVAFWCLRPSRDVVRGLQTAIKDRNREAGGTREPVWAR